MLTGINLGDFESNGNSLIDLLQALDDQSLIPRFRISSIEPNLLSDEIIEIPESDIFRQRKINPEDILYWITEYKDLQLAKLYPLKPTLPKYIPCQEPYYNLFKTFKKRWIDVDYYVIEFNLPGNISRDTYLEYRTEYSEWIYKTRVKSVCI